MLKSRANASPTSDCDDHWQAPGSRAVCSCRRGRAHRRGDVDRQTRDLDLFGPDPAGVDKLVPAVERALHEAGMNVRRVREGRGFFRLEVREHEEVTEVDLGADARLLPIERGELGPILAGEELAVDKVLAVFGRAEARDFVDLSAVAEQLQIRRDRGDDFGLSR